MEHGRKCTCAEREESVNTCQPWPVLGVEGQNPPGVFDMLIIGNDK